MRWVGLSLRVDLQFFVLYCRRERKETLGHVRLERRGLGREGVWSILIPQRNLFFSLESIAVAYSAQMKSYKKQ
jgi:hypothetical protein